MFNLDTRVILGTLTIILSIIGLYILEKKEDFEVTDEIKSKRFYLSRDGLYLNKDKEVFDGVKISIKEDPTTEIEIIEGDEDGTVFLYLPKLEKFLYSNQNKKKSNSIRLATEKKLKKKWARFELTKIKDNKYTIKTSKGTFIKIFNSRRESVLNRTIPAFTIHEKKEDKNAILELIPIPSEEETTKEDGTTRDEGTGKEDGNTKEEKGKEEGTGREDGNTKEEKRRVKIEEEVDIEKKKKEKNNNNNTVGIIILSILVLVFFFMTLSVIF